MTHPSRAAARRDTILRSTAMAAIAALSGAAASAQEAGQPLQSGAANETAAPQAIDRIVVTAEFRNRTVEDSPLSITAVTAEMLEARSQSNIFQVAEQTPNVTMQPAGGAQGGSAMLAYIRGVGQTDFNYALEPGVGLYVDDVYFPTLAGGLVELVDLDRVEVLRGPQGTLAGKNSLGGAIKLYSRRPDGDDGGQISATVGGYGRVDLRGAAEFTLAEDRLFARISGLTRSIDGYVDRLDYGCLNPGAGVPAFSAAPDCRLGTEGGQDFTVLKGALRFIATPDFELNLSADMTRENSEARPGVLVRALGNGQDFGIPDFFGPGQGLLLGTDFNPADGNGGPTPVPIFFDNNNNGVFDPGVDVPLDCRFVTFGPESCDPNAPGRYISYATYMSPESAAVLQPGQDPWKPLTVPPMTKFESHGVSLTADWEIAPDFALKSITAYREYSSTFSEDTDGSPLGVQTMLQTLEHEQFSQELRLNGTLFGGAVDFTTGLFYFEQEGTLESRVDLPWAALSFVHGPDPTPSTNKAAFVNATWHVTDRLNLTGGVRYSRDRKDYTFYRSNPDGTLPAGPCMGPPGHPANPANCGVFGVSGLSSTYKGDRFDTRAAIDYRWTRDIMTYASFSTGYKGGGVNPRPYVPDQVQTFEPETLKTWEAGFKTTWWGRRLQLNGAAFINRFSNIQLSFQTCPSSIAPAPCLMPQNAGDAEVLGFELEGVLRPLPGLQLDGSLGVLDFEYTRVDPLTNITADMVPPYTPALTWSLGVQYDIDLGGMGLLTPRLDVSSQSHVHTESANAPTNRIDGYRLVNGRLTWRAPDDQWSLALEVTNLLDKYYYHTLLDLSPFGNAGYTSGQPGWPRTWAVTLTRRF